MPAAVPGSLLIRGAVVERLRGLHLRANRFHARSVGDDLQIGAGRGLHHQVARVHHRELSGAPALHRRAIVLARTVVECVPGRIGAHIGVMERSGNGGNGDAREL